MKKKLIMNLLLIVLPIIIVIGVVQFARENKSSEAWLADRDSVLPQFVTTGMKSKVPIVFREFSPEVDLAYAVDTKEEYSFVLLPQLLKWKIDEEELYDRAMKNLEIQAKDSKMEVATTGEKDKAGKYVIVELDDSYSAVKLLSSTVRKAVAKELGDEFIAAIPTRDFLIFWHINFPLADAFTQQVKTEFEAGGAFALSPELFHVSKQGIQSVTLQKAEESN